MTAIIVTVVVVLLLLLFLIGTGVTLIRCIRRKREGNTGSENKGYVSV